MTDPQQPHSPGITAQSLYEHAKTRIPGGVHLLSKQPEQFAPNQWPAYYSRAKGCQVWDIDDRHYYDFSINGIGSCLLGFADPDVTQAVQSRIANGSMCTLNPPEEVALADKLCQLHPWAKMVRLSRAGGETGAIAVRIARATTGRSKVAVCGYHGWHDWYLAANLGGDHALDGHLLPGLQPTGVPRQLGGTTLTFHYGSIDEFDAVMDAHGDELAAVVMEPCRHHAPPTGFLEHIRLRTQQKGVLLIFDEITIGFRLLCGGAHMKFGVSPDMAMFAKALGNGHPIGAVIGTSAAMEGAHDSFISSTYWTEGVGPTAALATLDKFQAVDVPAHVADIGNMIQDTWRSHAKRTEIPVKVSDGYSCVSSFTFDHEQAAALVTLYVQTMLDQGFLAGPLVYATLAHTHEHVELFDKAVGVTFDTIAGALENNTIGQALRGPIKRSGFARLM